MTAFLSVSVVLLSVHGTAELKLNSHPNTPGSTISILVPSSITYHRCHTSNRWLSHLLILLSLCTKLLADSGRELVHTVLLSSKTLESCSLESRFYQRKYLLSLLSGSISIYRPIRPSDWTSIASFHGYNTFKSTTSGIET